MDYSLLLGIHNLDQNRYSQVRTNLARFKMTRLLYMNEKFSPKNIRIFVLWLNVMYIKIKELNASYDTINISNIHIFVHFLFCD